MITIFYFKIIITAVIIDNGITILNVIIIIIIPAYYSSRYQ